jgi:hypothetical protein
MSVRAAAVVGGNPATVVCAGFDNAQLRRTLRNDIDRRSLAPA